MYIIVTGMYLIITLGIIVSVIDWCKNKVGYKDCAYYRVTHNKYFSMRFNKGRFGEYLTYKSLKKYEETGAKFLFNAYIPKGNNETTEIDVLMICSNGIFVFESKNYGGWIFGSEDQKYWYQTLKAGRGRSRKEQFYNPIMQNRTHIKHLKNLVGDNIPMKSIITFSDRCVLKSIKITSHDVNVINRYHVNSVVKQICNQSCETLLTTEQINEIYNKIYPYTQVNEAVKTQHVANIQETFSPMNYLSMTRNVTDTSINNTVIVNEVNTANTANTAVKVTPAKIICPKCGAELILRTARRGANVGNQFYGCSKYPKCKYIQDVIS